MNNNFSCIVLAAGSSSRIKNWKPGAILGNKTILHHTLSSVSAVCNDIVVVGGFNYNELKELVLYISKELNQKINCTENKDYLDGMYSTVRTGLKEVINDNTFIALSDMPFVNSATYFKMIDFFNNLQNNYDVVFPANIINKTRDKKGHPVLINSAVKNLILKDTSNAILRDVLKQFRTINYIVDDEGINFDIDTDEDLEKAKQLLTLKED